MELQQFLRGGKTIEDLYALYSIKAVQHKKYPELYLFKYNQIESPFAERIVQESRGVILNKNDNWNIVSRAFDKFFNHGEQLAAKIDWNEAYIQEKLDGSLISMYWYDGKWNVATSGSPDASGDVFGHGFTFEELFWKTFTDLGYKPPPERHKCITFIFELMTMYNRVVVAHKEPRLVLIGMRCNVDELSTELDIHDSASVTKPLGYEKVRLFVTESSIDNIVASFSNMDPVSQEGYVVMDVDFKRIKVKHPGYVQLHRFKDGMSKKALLEIIRTGETSELLVHFPEWKEMHDEIFEKYESLKKRIAETHERTYNTLSQKAFAMMIKELPYSGILFSLRAGKIKSIAEGLKNLDIDRLYTLIYAEVG
jgi:hypothetical protein